MELKFAHKKIDNNVHQGKVGILTEGIQWQTLEALRSYIMNGDKPYLESMIKKTWTCSKRLGSLVTNAF